MYADDGIWHAGDLRQSCNARIVSTGSNLITPIMCIGIQLFGLALFFAFPARYLFVERNSVAAIVVGAILGGLSLCMYLAAWGTDPGVVPPAEIPPYMSHELRPPRIQNVVTSNGTCVLKYCDNCHIYRPPRAEHCPQCKNCILKYDHRTLS